MTSDHCYDFIKSRTMAYPTDLNHFQYTLIKSSLSGYVPKLRKYSLFRIINAILYVVKTGCQWYMLPKDFPPYRIVYHHWRSLCDRDMITTLLHELVKGKRAALGKDPEPVVAVIDSESVRWGVPNSEKGIDGHKRVKGIKRHIAVDEEGLPLAIHVTKANIHDSKGAVPLIDRLMNHWPGIGLVKADQGYRGLAEQQAIINTGLRIETVKSNFGTSEFIPLDGRWVVERSISWFTGTRRMLRNYEKYLHTAAHMAQTCMVAFMLGYFR